MKNKLFTSIFLLLLLVIVSLVFASCSYFEAESGGDGENVSEVISGKEITGISFDSRIFTYDGEEKRLEISGFLPEGVVCVYENEKHIEAGTYIAKATLKGRGYNTLILSANLVIEKADYDMSGVSWSYSEAFRYDGKEKSVFLEGLPQGVSVKKYTGNVQTNSGSYTARAEFSFDTENYNIPKEAVLEWKIDKADFDISAVKWNYESHFVYDGEKKSVQLINLPNGYVLEGYTGNEKVDVGEYKTTAKISYDAQNYNTPPDISLNWKIEKADFTDITIANPTASYRTLDFKYELELSGKIPKDAKITYYYNGKEADFVTYGGIVDVAAVIEHPNYNTYKLQGRVKIRIIPNNSFDVLNIAPSALSNEEFVELLEIVESENVRITDIFEHFPPHSYKICSDDYIYYRHYSNWNGNNEKEYMGSLAQYKSINGKEGSGAFLRLFYKVVTNYEVETSLFIVDCSLETNSVIKSSSYGILDYCLFDFIDAVAEHEKSLDLDDFPLGTKDIYGGTNSSVFFVTRDGYCVFSDVVFSYVIIKSLS